jgi:DNA-binding transcriptional MocR family regulator
LYKENLYWHFRAHKLYCPCNAQSPKNRKALFTKRLRRKLVQMIDSGRWRWEAGRRRCVRSARQLKVSISTVIAAYRLLEDRGRLQARPQSGFYVRALRRENVAEPQMSRPPETAVRRDGRRSGAVAAHRVRVSRASSRWARPTERFPIGR